MQKITKILLVVLMLFSTGYAAKTVEADEVVIDKPAIPSVSGEGGRVVDLTEAELRAAEALQAENAKSEPTPLKGDAYAILTEDFEFIFFRSETKYENGGEYENVLINDKAYSGIVWSGIEKLDLIANDPDWVDYAPHVVSVKVADGHTIRPYSIASWFYLFQSITSFSAKGFDFSECYDFRFAFYGCVSLESVDLKGVDTSKVNYFNQMFYACFSLTELDLTDLDTDSAVSMARMFEGLPFVETLDLSNFKTDNVTNMSLMFAGYFDNSSNAYYSSFKSLDLSSFNMEKVLATEAMFAGCEELQEVKFSSDLETPALLYTDAMFYDCWTLPELDLSVFDTSNVTHMEEMFEYCPYLRTLDISGFSTEAVEKMTDMFYYCYSLNTVVLGKGFVYWADDALLPDGCWYRKGHEDEVLYVEDEVEYNYLPSKLLQILYPDHAADLQGTWTQHLFFLDTDQYITTSKYLEGCSYVVAGQKVQYRLTDDYFADGVEWFALDENKEETECATVDDNGLATGVKAGLAFIYAYNEDIEYYDSLPLIVEFTDVANQKKYYFEPVYWALINGITTGTSPTTFSPDKNCTREQVVTFLWRTVGCPEPESSEMPFSDVKEGKYYYDAVLWAYQNDITTGVTPDRFGVGSECTREQVVTFLYRTARYAGMPEYEGTTDFSDVPEGKYYYIPVAWAYDNGITTGTSPTTFGVKKPCVRGMIVTFLKRFSDGYSYLLED